MLSKSRSESSSATLPTPHHHDKMLDGGKVRPVLEAETDRQGLRLARAANDEILK